jgi:hypothetical protein
VELVATAAVVTAKEQVETPRQVQPTQVEVLAVVLEMALPPL